MILELLVFFIFAASIYKLSPVAFIYASLIHLHDQYFGHLSTPETYHIYTMWGGVFTTMGLAVCYYFRQNINDTIAFWLYNIGLLTLSVNILTIYMAANSFNMDSLIPVFVAINVLSVLAIIHGDSGGIRLPTIHYFSNRNPDKRDRRRSGLVSGEERV
jgi:hypothetical protein